MTANVKWLEDRLRDAVNVCYGGVTHEEIDAAVAEMDCLIAAAPELLAELKELHAVVWGECPSLFNEDSGGNAVQEARICAAIDKAQGR